jgi:chemotaxis protein MotB
MKKAFFFTGILGVMALTSCVSLSEHENLQAKYDQTAKQYRLTLQERDELRENNANLTKTNNALTSDYNELSAAKQRCDGMVDSLTRRIEQMRHHYDTTMENYTQAVAGKDRDLTRAQNLLSARTKELNEKEREIEQKETELRLQQESFLLQRSELIAKQQELEQKEAAARAQLEAMRNSVTQALIGFADKGLKVETKDGKVYVSMENKLMFPSASWTVSKEGSNAIKELAKVLEQDTTLNIMVEGHTDNDAYRGSSAVKDNWDLSVMRATSIVKLLLQHGKNINPARIEACGHGEYAPKASNSTAEGKAANRRTEIILTPNLDKLLNEMNR